MQKSRDLKLFMILIFYETVVCSLVLRKILNYCQKIEPLTLIYKLIKKELESLEEEL